MTDIDSNIKLPKPKYKLKDEERRRKLFRNYAEAYEHAYFQRPTHYKMRGNLMAIHRNDTVLEVSSEFRIEVRIRQMRERIKDR